MTVVEINEAFVAQYLDVERELGLDREQTNVNGGAIAISHPVRASGAPGGFTLRSGLRRRALGGGLASSGVGGSQGIVAVFEAGRA
jgi:acetyl-CoA acetyltransferase